MRKIGMDELRQKQMEVLDYVAALCDEKGIRIGLRAAQGLHSLGRRH